MKKTISLILISALASTAMALPERVKTGQENGTNVKIENQKKVGNEEENLAAIGGASKVLKGTDVDNMINSMVKSLGSRGKNLDGAGLKEAVKTPEGKKAFDEIVSYYEANIKNKGKTEERTKAKAKLDTDLLMLSLPRERNAVKTELEVAYDRISAETFARTNVFSPENAAKFDQVKNLTVEFKQSGSMPTYKAFKKAAGMVEIASENAAKAKNYKSLDNAAKIEAFLKEIEAVKQMDPKELDEAIEARIDALLQRIKELCKG